MSIEVIEKLTTEFADLRTDAITAAADMQAEIDEIKRRHAKQVRIAVEALIAKQDELSKALEANQALFPEGQKSIVIKAIKVGFQQGKAYVAGVDDTVTVVKLELLREAAATKADGACLERIAAAVAYIPKLSDAGLRKLSPAEMAEIGISIQPGEQSVLIKPADQEAYNALKDTIKLAMAATTDI